MRHNIDITKLRLITVSKFNFIGWAVKAEKRGPEKRGQTRLLFGSLYDDHLSATELSELHRHWGERLHRHWRAQTRNITASSRADSASGLDRDLAPVPDPFPVPTWDGQRPSRIGYLSADLRDHPVGRFLAPILRHHDPARVAVSCYHASFGGDSLTSGRIVTVFPIPGFSANKRKLEINFS